MVIAILYRFRHKKLVLYHFKLKITIIAPSPGEEEEIIFKCHTLTDEMKQLVYRLEHGDMKLTGYDENGICPLEVSDVYYFEATDNKVFAYCERDVYEVREKLYQLEELLVSFPFMRASKSMILNLNKIKHLSPAFGGRFEALLENKEKVIISRQYVLVLKERLGL